jgi:hypothetical protein
MSYSILLFILNGGGFMQCFCKEESYGLVLEADFGADPIWCKRCGCNLDLDEVPLTQELKNELINVMS